MGSQNLSLISNMNRVSAPFIKVQIGDYVFGVFQKSELKEKDSSGFYKITKITYPNFIQDLSIVKINGQVNQYTLKIIYPITNVDDPNFFEKVFSSVSDTRKIIFSYGDALLPKNYIYKDEEAIIVKVTSDFNALGSSITYNVSAVSSAALSLSGSEYFPPRRNTKPSDVIKQLIASNSYGLSEIFYGMKDIELVKSKGLIYSDDAEVNLEAKYNISVFDYISYLVSCMIPSSAKNTLLQKSFCVLTLIDDTSGDFGGPYFKVSLVTKGVEVPNAYEIDIGFPTANIVTQFSIDDKENYSLYYKWQSALNSEEYVSRINDDGEYEYEYAPELSSNNAQHITRVNDKTWWSKVTEYPISASITIKGLLRPAILMTYVKLNILFYGKKHIHSGLYIITKQQDTISSRGCFTQLTLTRIGGDTDNVN